jgi:Cof subfamily protein (haloacid dehalogenase superfamily)
MIKLIAIDLDGTFLTSSRKPSQANIDAVNTALDHGVHVCFASGRMRPTILPFASLTRATEPMIACNGCHVVGPNRETVALTNLAPEILKTTLEYAQAHHVHLNVYATESVFELNKTNWGDVYYQRVNAHVPLVDDPQTVWTVPFQKVLFVDDPARIPIHRKALESVLPLESVSITESEPEYLEFLPKNANKGSALHQLLGFMNLDKSASAAIGDYLNDYEMLQYVGFSATVQNAHPEIKKIVDRTFRSNDEDGVAEFIHHIIHNLNG